MTLSERSHAQNRVLPLLMMAMQVTKSLWGAIPLQYLSALFTRPQNSSTTQLISTQPSKLIHKMLNLEKGLI